MLLMVTTLAIYAAVWANAVELERLRRHGLAALLYVANWLFISDGTTYTDVVTGASPLRHVWSLSIEEQFYVILAGAIALAAAFTATRRSTRRCVIVGSVVLGAASALWMIIANFNGSSLDRLYFGADTRAQALLIGAALGATLRGGSPSQDHAGRRLLHCCPLPCWSPSPATASENVTWMYRGGFTLVATRCRHGHRRWASDPVDPPVLEWPPLRLLGVISYGVYLWHWPILVILDEARLGLRDFAHRIVVLVVTLIVATLSYRLLERPIRQGAIGDRWGPRSIAIGPACTAAVAAALIVVTRRTRHPRGRRRRTDRQDRRDDRLRAAAPDVESSGHDRDHLANRRGPDNCADRDQRVHQYHQYHGAQSLGWANSRRCCRRLGDAHHDRRPPAERFTIRTVDGCRHSL